MFIASFMRRRRAVTSASARLNRTPQTIMKAFRVAALAAAAVLLLLRPPDSRAQTVLLWDAQPGTGGVQGGTGNWLGTNNWRTILGGNGMWSDGALAVFNGTPPGTVTVNGPVAAAELTFNVNGYTISGASTLAVADTIQTTNAGQTTTISAPLGGGAGLTKGGAGTLTLGGSAANSYTGLATVTDGVLNLSKSGVNALT